MKTQTEKTAQTPDDVLNDLRSLVAEAEKILAQTHTENDGAVLADLRERLEAAREQITTLYEGTRRKVVAGARYTDETIRENPYQSLAVALGLGLLVGVLLGRRGNSSSQ